MTNYLRQRLYRKNVVIPIRMTFKGRITRDPQRALRKTQRSSVMWPGLNGRKHVTANWRESGADCETTATASVYRPAVYRVPNSCLSNFGRSGFRIRIPDFFWAFGDSGFPGASIFLLWKRSFTNSLSFYFLFFGNLIDLTKLNLKITSHLFWFRLL